MSFLFQIIVRNRTGEPLEYEDHFPSSWPPKGPETIDHGSDGQYDFAYESGEPPEKFWVQLKGASGGWIRLGADDESALMLQDGGFEFKLPGFRYKKQGIGGGLTVTVKSTARSDGDSDGASS